MLVAVSGVPPAWWDSAHLQAGSWLGVGSIKAVLSHPITLN